MHTIMLQNKSNLQNLAGFMVKPFVVIFILLLFHSAVFGQYYPSQKLISPDKEKQLLRLLKKSHPNKDKIGWLLSLSNINMNRPLKRLNKLDAAMAFAVAARNLSTSLHDVKAYNEAQLVVADIYTMQGNMKAAEDILPLVNDTSKIKLGLILSYKYWLRYTNNDEDAKKALFYAEQARASSITHHLPLYEILALKYIASVHFTQSKPSTESELKEVLRRYKALKYPNLHYIHYLLSGYYYQNGDPVKALHNGIEMIKSMRATGDTLHAGDFYFAMSMLSINNEDYQKGFDFADLAISHSKIHAGEFGLDDHLVFATAVRALRKMKKYKEALQYAHKVQKNYPPSTTANKIWDAKMIGDIYRDMKDYDRAAFYLLKALDLGKKQNPIDLGPYKDVGQLYVESGQYAKAKPYLSKVEKSDQFNEWTSGGKSHIKYMLYMADSATGDYLSAIKRLSAFRRVADSNLLQAQLKEIKKLEVEYKTKEKENELKIQSQNILLLKQNNKLQETRLRETKIEQVITIGAILVLTLIIVLLYRQYKHKQHTSFVISKKSEAIAQKSEVIIQKNQLLESLLQEKEWLLKEVHHRVKNNLHTIICLLESQASYLENDALRAIEKSQNRIYTMSLIHQKLYQSDDIETIDMASYIPELIQYLRDSFDISDQVYFNLCIEQINLAASQAIPLALIINEVLTNSIKYAFPENRKGEIFISFRASGEFLRMELADNGIGFEKNVQKKESNSLGMELIKGLTKELKGNITFKSNHGVKIMVSFKPDILSNIDASSQLIILN
jgi:two-component sensor histidine kinase